MIIISGLKILNQKYKIVQHLQFYRYVTIKKGKRFSCRTIKLIYLTDKIHFPIKLAGSKDL